MSGFRSVNKLPARTPPTCDYQRQTNIALVPASRTVEKWITLNHLFHCEWEDDIRLGQQEFRVSAID